MAKKKTNKNEVIVKIDGDAWTKALDKAFKKKVDCEVYPISAITGKDLDKVLIKIADLIDQDNNEEIYEEDEMLSHVLYKFEKEKPYTIEKEDDYFVIRGDEVERLFRMTKFESDESVLRFARQIRKMGIDDDLEKLGAKEGDIVKILDFSFEYRK